MSKSIWEILEKMNEQKIKLIMINILKEMNNYLTNSRLIEDEDSY